MKGKTELKTCAYLYSFMGLCNLFVSLQKRSEKNIENLHMLRFFKIWA